MDDQNAVLRRPAKGKKFDLSAGEFPLLTDGGRATVVGLLQRGLDEFEADSLHQPGLHDHISNEAGKVAAPDFDGAATGGGDMLLYDRGKKYRRHSSAGLSRAPAELLALQETDTLLCHVANDQTLAVP